MSDSHLYESAGCPTRSPHRFHKEMLTTSFEGLACCQRYGLQCHSPFQVSGLPAARYHCRACGPLLHPLQHLPSPPPPPDVRERAQERFACARSWLWHGRPAGVCDGQRVGLPPVPCCAARDPRAAVVQPGQHDAIFALCTTEVVRRSSMRGTSFQRLYGGVRAKLI